MSEASEKKAHAYLTSGKVQVVWHTDHGATIAVQGSGKEPYSVVFGNATWACTCPARKPLCAHVIAAKLISPLRTESGSLTHQPDPELDELLGDLKPSPKANDEDDLSFLDGLGRPYGE